MPIQTAADSISNSAGSPYGFKNRIINGAMGIWQRATTQTFTNSLVYGSVDRWAFIQGGASASISQTQSTVVPTGFQYAIKQQRTAASTTTGTVYSVQEIETVNCYDLAGQTVTLSFWAKCGTNFSASGSTLTSVISQGTGTDQGTTSWISGTWTSPTSTTQSNTLTTTYQKFTQTITLGVATTELVIALQWVPVGTAGADDSVFITGVQLEEGVQATAFDYRDYGRELILCQRYYFKTNDVGSATGANGAPIVGIGSSTNGCIVCGFRYPVQMRTTPTLAFTSFNGTSGVWSTSATNADTAAATVNGSAASGLQQVIVAGLTTGQPYYVYATASAEL
jgi:hypothetical protein